MPGRIEFLNGGGFKFDVNAKEKSITFTNVDHATLMEEIKERTNADGKLQTNINAEAEARKKTDAALQTNIDAETEAREEADAALQTNIDAAVRTLTEADEYFYDEIKVKGDLI